MLLELGRSWTLGSDGISGTNLQIPQTSPKSRREFEKIDGKPVILEFENWEDGGPSEVMEFQEVTYRHLNNSSNPEQTTKKLLEILVFLEFQLLDSCVHVGRLKNSHIVADHSKTPQSSYFSSKSGGNRSERSLILTFFYVKNV